MLQFVSKAFSFAARPSSLAPLTQGLIAQSLHTPLYFNFGHSKQKIIVRYEDELRPFTINNLWDNDGARRTPKKIGRGVGTGKGKTSGKGHKGQRARAGGSIRPAFEGGQTPLTERLPKWGIKRQNLQRPNYINVEQILYLVKRGRLNTENVITIKDLYDAGAFKRVKFGVKVLGRGADKLNFPLKLEVSDASETVINAVKQNGGSVTCIYRTKLKMKEHLKPHMFAFPLEEPLPAKKTVENLERIRERGAEVIYNMPDWKKKEKEEVAKAEKELKEAEFEFPVKRYEGMGKDKVRERKVPLQKHIDFGFN